MALKVHSEVGGVVGGVMGSVTDGELPSLSADKGSTSAPLEGDVRSEEALGDPR